MANPLAVTNTSPVIALTCLSHLDLLCQLYRAVLVPFAVWNELSAKKNASEPPALLALATMQFAPDRPAPPATSHLHVGERQAIAVALANPGAFVIIDDGQARKVARGLGVPVIGTVGILLEAKRARIIPQVRPLLTALAQTTFRVSPKLVRAVLKVAGEL